MPTSLKDAAVIIMSRNTKANRDRICSFLREGAKHTEMETVFIDSFRRNWRHTLSDLCKKVHLKGILTTAYDEKSVSKAIAGLRTSPRIIVADEVFTTMQAKNHLAIDNSCIGHAAARFLAERSYPNTAYIGCANDIGDTLHAKHRGDAFAEESARTGVRFVDSYTILGTAQNDRRLLNFLFSLPKPCGVFVFNDLLARDIVDVCRNSGILVPDALGILGADNEAEICESAYPTLSSITVDFGWAGRAACRIFCGDAGIGTSSPPTVFERESTRSMKSGGRIVAAAQHLIRESNGNLSASELAQKLHLSMRTLQARFHEVLGHGPKEEILMFRLERAAKLLKTTSLTVSEIAFNCAFASPELFHRHFTCRYGATPASWRRQNTI